MVVTLDDELTEGDDHVWISTYGWDARHADHEHIGPYCMPTLNDEGAGEMAVAAAVTGVVSIAWSTGETVEVGTIEIPVTYEAVSAE